MLVLVTGAAGFIGSHLSERLIGDGYGVVGVDSFLDYYPKKVKEANIAALLSSPKFRFIEGDIAELNLSKLLDGVSVVFHQAAVAGVRASWGKQFEMYVSNNILATQLLLEASKDIGLKKFVYASSSSVYGDTKELPITESSPTEPFSPYGVSKLAGEHLAVLYHRNFDVPTISLRYFTVYGPRQRPDMGFHRFLFSAIKGEPIEIYGDGTQTRDFTYIESAVEANILAMDKGRAGAVYNIGGGDTISVGDVISVIERIAGQNVDVIYSQRQMGDVMHTHADINKAVSEIGYHPVCSVEEGLSRHYEWLKENIDLYE